MENAAEESSSPPSAQRKSHDSLLGKLEINDASMNSTGGDGGFNVSFRDDGAVAGGSELFFSAHGGETETVRSPLGDRSVRSLTRGDSYLSKLISKRELVSSNVRRASMPPAPPGGGGSPQWQEEVDSMDFGPMVVETGGAGFDNNIGGDATESSMTQDAFDESFKLIEINKQAAGFKQLYSPVSDGTATGVAMDMDKEYPIEVRLENVTYRVPYDPGKEKIQTVFNSSMVYKTWKFFKRHLFATEKENNHDDSNNNNSSSSGKKNNKPTKCVLDDINLVIEPGKMYLILGNPGSGKSSLLKAIAGRLSTDNGESKEGIVSYNGKTLQEKSDYHIENAVAFIDQLDNHQPRLTVDETFEFAFQCKTGGTHIHHNSGNEQKHNKVRKSMIKKNLDKERVQVNIILEALGLSHVKDTFVGNDAIRGVSGGQRRRVTVGEMLMERTPILCGDEISTGLDALSTYEMIQLLMNLGRIQKMSRVVSLLQPSPETVSLFDEVIVIDGGRILFAGPIGEVEQYFASLGYSAPDQMDVADFLTAISTPDAEALFQNDNTTIEGAPLLPSIREGSGDDNDNDDNNNSMVPGNNNGKRRTKPYSSAELASIFRSSRFAKRIQKQLEQPLTYVWGDSSDDPQKTTAAKTTSNNDLSQWHAVQKKYANSFWRSTNLNTKRNITIWIRDRRTLIMGAVKNILMGVSVGGVFFMVDREDPTNVLGCLFQSMLFITLGAMQVAPGLVDDRSIFRKQADANFFSAYPFVLGRAISQIPQSLIDILQFGTILYFMVGLTPAAGNFFIFVAVLFFYSLVTNQFMSMFAAILPTKAMVQVISACIVLLLILFGGFIVPPDAIPDYYIWIFWWNPMAWAFRAIVVNEYTSPRYGPEDSARILQLAGFYVPRHGAESDVLFGTEWVYYSFLYMVPYFLLSLVLTGVGLTYARGGSANSSKGSSSSSSDSSIDSGTDNKSRRSSRSTERQVEGIPFVPVNLSFEDICYDVKASKGKEKLRLLHDINGVFRPGRMCALMGSSGAGKTTLMDVIALRKNTGTISGEVRMNGYLQDPVSFRRSSGYVEQFDVQSPQLTVRETVRFSAQLRLNPEHVRTDELREKFVDYALKVLELRPLGDSLVGSSEGGGLSFEQKKRLSIAVELAASPSIIFLDEPTSGLDARSALLVVKLLRRISDSGRTICATIHQPSSAVFEMFHDLLLLKKGGHVVYFGELGDESNHLIHFFESRGVRSINLNENPANWMLEVLASDDDAARMASDYKESEEHASLKNELSEIKAADRCADDESKIVFATRFAASFRTRQRLVSRRISRIYWRSPAYNYSRMLVSGGIAFILGSVFLTNYRPERFTESVLKAFFAVIFLSFIIVGILSMFSVLPVMVNIRDMYYRHLAAGMIDSTSLAWALGVAEKGYILVSSILFSLVFILTSGLFMNLRNTIGFWGFFTFNSAIYSYFGQCFVCLVKPMRTATILATVFIGLNNFFSGFIARPQIMVGGFFVVPFWITPGHFVYEGMIISAFGDDDRPVVADVGSEFYERLNCTNTTETTPCEGTVSEYVDVFFGGRYRAENIWIDAMVLGFILTLARILTFVALRFINLS